MTFPTKISALVICSALVGCGTSGVTTDSDASTGGTGSETPTPTTGSVGSSVSVGTGSGTSTPDCANDPQRPGCTGTTVTPNSTFVSTGDLSSVAYDAAADELTVTSALPFDGGGKYSRVAALDQGRFRAFVTEDAPVGPALRSYLALFAQSASGDMTATVAGSADYGNLGFRGTSYSGTTTAITPSSGSARYTGDYASILKIDGSSFTYILNGNAILDVDFTDLAVGGSVSGRRINYVPGLEQYYQFPLDIRDSSGRVVNELLDLIDPNAEAADDPLQNGTISSMTELVAYFENNPDNPLEITPITIDYKDLVLPTIDLVDTKDVVQGSTFTGATAGTLYSSDMTLLNPNAPITQLEIGTYEGMLGGPNLEEAAGSVTITAGRIAVDNKPTEENGVFVAEGGVLVPDNTN